MDTDKHGCEEQRCFGLIRVHLCSSVANSNVRIDFNMRIAIGADHAGFDLKNRLRDELRAAGHEVRDFGANSEEPLDDYPDYAFPVAHAVSSAEVDKGILVCGSGAGMAIAANKVRGVRAIVGENIEEVRLTRSHNDANILSLGARFLAPQLVDDAVRIFLETPFDGGRHKRRVDKISAMESGS